MKAGTIFGLAGAVLLGAWVLTGAAEPDPGAESRALEAPHSPANGLAVDLRAAPVGEAHAAPTNDAAKSKTADPKQLPRHLTSKAGCFTVTFPSRPTFGSADKHTIVGTIEERWYVAWPKGGQFLVGYTHLPEFLVFFGGQDLILDRARDIFLKREHSKQLSYTHLKMDGFEGREINYERKNGVRGRAHMIFIEKRIYLMSGYSATGMELAEEFLKSFKLDRKCAEH